MSAYPYATGQTIDAAEKHIAELTDLLLACAEYFDHRADVQDGDYGIPRPNEEMQMLSRINELVKPAISLTDRRFKDCHDDGDNDDRRDQQWDEDRNDAEIAATLKACTHGA